MWKVHLLVTLQENCSKHGNNTGRVVSKDWDSPQQQPCTHTRGPSHPFPCKMSAQPLWSGILLLLSECGTSPATHHTLELCSPALQLKAQKTFCRPLGSRRHTRSLRPSFLLLVKLSCSMLFSYTALASHSQRSIAF